MPEAVGAEGDAQTLAGVCYVLAQECVIAAIPTPAIRKLSDSAGVTTSCGIGRWAPLCQPRNIWVRNWEMIPQEASFF